MDWIQTFTIISTIIAALYAFYVIMKEDLKRHDAQFSKMEERFYTETSKRDTLWATLLEKICTIEKQIYEIKLDQSKKA